VRLTWHDEEGGTVHELLWETPDGFHPEGVLASGGPIPGALARADVICALELGGPRLPAEPEHALREGDIMLVPALSRRLCPATLHAPAPVGRVRGCTLRIDGADPTDPPQETTMTDTQDAPAELLSMAAPTRVIIDHLPLPLERVAALRPGAILPLVLPEAGLPVRILSGEAEIASGALVAVGDGYGVLVETAAGGGQAG
jgi:type III secretion protein Q